MKWQRVLGAILAALGAIGITLRIALESAIIVALGIHILSFWTTMACFLLGAGIGNIAVSFSGDIKKRLQRNRANKLLADRINREKELVNDYESDSLNPEKVRVRLEQLRKRNPHLDSMMSKCLVQKDEIDRYQEQLDRLIQANDALYLNDVPAVLDSAEERICANFRDIINCCILVEYNDGTISKHNQDIIIDALKSNGEELEAVRTLLDRSVAYINDYNRKGISDRRELDAWIKVMEEKIDKKGGLTLE